MTRLMDIDFEVVVGTGPNFVNKEKYTSQNTIANALESYGYKVRRVDNAWPRDSYVLYGNSFFRKKCSNSILYPDHFGEGGNIFEGEVFILVSDFLTEDIPDHLDPGYCNDPDKEFVVNESLNYKYLLEEGKKRTGYENIKIIPTGLFSDEDLEVRDHIDPFISLFPRSKLLIVDRSYNEAVRDSEVFDAIADEEGLTLINYEGKEDAPTYPVNVLVLPKEDGGEIAFCEFGAVNLEKILRDEGIEVVPIDVGERGHSYGGIRCQTNIYIPSLGIPLEELVKE